MLFMKLKFCCKIHTNQVTKKMSVNISNKVNLHLNYQSKFFNLWYS